MSKTDGPKSVLFVCNMNQIRSPMAEFLTRDLFGNKVFAQSAGLYRGEEDGFMISVMQERGVDTSSHEPETLEELDDHFVDLVVTLADQARDGVAEFFRGESVEIEHWPTENPSIAVGRRDDVLLSYRKTRNDLERLIKDRFNHV